MGKKEEAKKALEAVRPFLQADGGDVELIDVLDDGTVKVKLQGACGGCPMAQMTLKAGIEEHLRKELNWVKIVESV